MVDVMKGEGSGHSVALEMEYDWRPNGSYVRGVMADRFIPGVFRILYNLKSGNFVDSNIKGDENSWETTAWYSTKLSPTELFAKLEAAYENAYSIDGGPWAPKSFRANSAGPLATNMEFDDREGHHWKGVLSVESVEGEAHQAAIRVTVNRVS